MSIIPAPHSLSSQILFSVQPMFKFEGRNFFDCFSLFYFLINIFKNKFKVYYYYTVTRHELNKNIIKS